MVRGAGPVSLNSPADQLADRLNSCLAVTDWEALGLRALEGGAVGTLCKT